jgi:hypothetical protein
VFDAAPFPRREYLSLPRSQATPLIGASCHELRMVAKEDGSRIIYRIDHDAAVGDRDQPRRYDELIGDRQ